MRQENVLSREKVSPLTLALVSGLRSRMDESLGGAWHRTEGFVYFVKRVSGRNSQRSDFLSHTLDGGCQATPQMAEPGVWPERRFS